MQKASNLIRANQSQFPDCAYYLPLLSKARRNAVKHPDICIEICKSVLEGISKTVVLSLEPSSRLEDLDRKDVGQIVKLAAKILKANDDVIEDNFVTRATSLVNALGALRNVRGDISHGKAVPKLESSTDGLAKLCLQMTDAIAFYLLDSFFAIQREAAETGGATPDQEQDFEAEVTTGIPDIRYEANSDFNDQLDADNPPVGKIVYSEALYRLYYEDYVIELEAYQDAREEALEDQEGESE